MKIWVTRQTAFSIQCGGIDRLDVWFQKPQYTKVYYHRDDMPFGYGEEGCLSQRWQVYGGKIQHSFSFGGAFGYGSDSTNENNDLSKYVWHKLCNHFNDPNCENFEKWHEYENAGLAKQEDFLLELDIEIKLIK